MQNIHFTCLSELEIAFTTKREPKLQVDITRVYFVIVDQILQITSRFFTFTKDESSVIIQMPKLQADFTSDFFVVGFLPKFLLITSRFFSFTKN